MAPAMMLSFERLPFDIQFEVVGFLDFLSALSLASTNRYFHQTVNPRASIPSEDLTEFLIGRDDCQRLKLENLFGCFKCFRMLPKHKFARSATRIGKQYKWTAKVPRQTDRACFDCAAKLRLFDHLRPISNGRLRYYFCHNCGEYKTSQVKCTGPRLCLDMEITRFVGGCVVPLKRREKSRLEALPVHILRNIVSFAEYGDAVRLAATSSVLHDTIEPVKWVPLHTRYQGIRDKWQADALDLAEEDVASYPCYMCCRVRPKAKFTWDQVWKARKWPETMWKMRCQSCLQQMARPGKNPLKREHFRRRWCDICKCIKVGGETCGGCMELYARGDIDRLTIFPKLAKAKRLAFEDYVNNYDGIFQNEFTEALGTDQADDLECILFSAL